MTATGTYDDGSTKKITGSVNWSSSKAAVFTVSSPGLIKGNEPGRATVTATSALWITVLLTALFIILLAPSACHLLGRYFWSSGRRFWTLDGDAMPWIGVMACFLGGLLRIIPVYVLRNRFSGLVAIQPGHRLETRGIYGVIRNPNYLGLLITSLGWVLTFRSGVGVLLVVSLLVPLVGADPIRGAMAARALWCRV